MPERYPRLLEYFRDDEATRDTISLIGQLPNSRDWYSCHRIPKSDGTHRLIEQPIDMLKSLQRKLIPIFEKFLFYDCIYGIKGKGSVDNGVVHLNKKVVVKMDIKSFFTNTTDTKIAIPISYHNNFDEYNLMNEALRFCLINSHNKLRLPTGAPTSPILANIAFSRIDDELMRIANKGRMLYTRYMDDLTFSGESYPNKLQAHICHLVSIYNYRINHQKSEVLYRDNDSINITGVRVNCLPTIDKNFKNNLRAALDHRARQNTSLTPELKGKLAYVQQMNRPLYRQFQEYFLRRCHRYQNSEN